MPNIIDDQRRLNADHETLRVAVQKRLRVNNGDLSDTIQGGGIQVSIFIRMTHILWHFSANQKHNGSYLEKRT
jgi:hypothetical protein